MMKKTVFILLILPLSFFAQTENQALKKVASTFEELYNKSQFQEIFELFSSEMKAALPLENTLDFFKGLEGQVGKINDREFIKYQQSYGSYKTTFERGVLALNLSINDDNLINGLFIKPYSENKLPTLERNITSLILPFNEEWTVVWGGDTKALNYHVESEAQKNAFDFVITDSDNKTYKTNGHTNEDYYAFGKPIIAPCNAEVVYVVDGVKDNIPGHLNPIYIPGNTVILKTENNEYLFFAHFKQHSIVVQQGDKINRGALLGLCGNSGNSSEAHLHFHIQNVEDINIATGVKCFFETILVNSIENKDHSPIQGEKIKNI